MPRSRQDPETPTPTPTPPDIGPSEMLDPKNVVGVITFQLVVTALPDGRLKIFNTLDCDGTQAVVDAVVDHGASFRDPLRLLCDRLSLALGANPDDVAHSWDEHKSSADTPPAPIVSINQRQAGRA